MTFQNIRPGDRMRFNRPNGIGRHGPEYKEATGRATICGPEHIVVNMGGPHGTPAVVDDRNFIKATPDRTRIAKTWLRIKA